MEYKNNNYSLETLSKRDQEEEEERAVPLDACGHFCPKCINIHFVVYKHTLCPKCINFRESSGFHVVVQDQNPIVELCVVGG